MDHTAEIRHQRIPGPKVVLVHEDPCLSSAARKGWVEQLKSGGGQATLRLTVLGSDVAARWKPLQDAAEERWRAKISVDPSGRLRTALEEVVAKMPLEHPHYLPVMERSTHELLVEMGGTGNLYLAKAERTSRLFQCPHYFRKPWLPLR